MNRMTLHTEENQYIRSILTKAAEVLFKNGYWPKELEPYKDRKDYKLVVEQDSMDLPLVLIERMWLKEPPKDSPEWDEPRWEIYMRPHPLFFHVHDILMDTELARVLWGERLVDAMTGRKLVAKKLPEGVVQLSWTRPAWQYHLQQMVVLPTNLEKAEYLAKTLNITHL